MNIISNMWIKVSCKGGIIIKKFREIMKNKKIFIIIFMLIYIVIYFVSFIILNLNSIMTHIVITFAYGLVYYFLYKDNWS